MFPKRIESVLILVLYLFNEDVFLSIENFLNVLVLFNYVS